MPPVSFFLVIRALGGLWFLILNLVAMTSFGRLCCGSMWCSLDPTALAWTEVPKGRRSHG